MAEKAEPNKQGTKTHQAKKVDAQKDEPKKQDDEAADAKKVPLNEPAKKDEGATKKNDSNKDAAKQDDIKKDETKKDETKKDETKKNETKKDETKKDETNKDDTKKDDAKKDDVKKGDTKEDDSRKQDSKKDDTKDGKKADSKKEPSNKGDSPPDQVDEGPKIPFPKVIYMYMGFYVFSGFGYHLKNSVLLLFYADSAKMGERRAKTVNHFLPYIGTILCIFGAMLGDDYLGYFKTLLIAWSILLPTVYIVPIASITTLNLPAVPLIYVSGILIAFSSSFSAPCLFPYISDQFVLPQQKKDYQWYLMAIYFINNIIAAISTFVGPHVRSSVHCFGREDCYSAVLFPSAIAVTIFYSLMIGCNTMFKKSPPNKQNATVKLWKLIVYAIKKKRKSTDKKKSLLDYGEDKFDKEFIEDAKRLKMLWVFIPRIIFNALVFQEQSAWVFQARRMDGDIGSYMIQPDQMYILNTVFCLILIPVFQYGIYPLFTKFKILKKPLSRICTGGVMYAIGYMLCGVICLMLEKGFHPIPKEHEGQLRIYNTMDCKLTLRADIFNEDIIIPSLEFYRDYKIKVDGEMVVPINYTCGSLEGTDKLVLFEKELHGFYFKKDGKLESFQEAVERIENGNPTIITLINSKSSVNYKYKISDYLATESNSETIKPLVSKAGMYTFYIGEDDDELFTQKFKLGGVYVVAIYETEEGNFTYNVNVVHPSNSIHMLWLTPEYFIDVIGEVMYSVAYQEFAYTQAPVSMKALVNIFVNLTDALGNFLISAVESSFKMKMSTNYFFYASLMSVTMAITGYFAFNFKYGTEKNKAGEEQEEGKKST